MSNMTSETEERKMSSDCISSSSIDEVSNVRNMFGNGTLRKRPWTSAEDSILVDYVNKHGEGNWNAVQKHSGLSRCGKSCRLRWANHLRPDLKKGAFTPEEERLIIELHAKVGNEWARMAVELPGRTSNEIKNFWNTRTKRRLRAGLPIYPPDICMQTLNDSTHTQNMVTFTNGDASNSEILPNDTFHIPAAKFKNLESNHELYAPSMLDIPGGNFLDDPGGSFLPCWSVCDDGDGVLDDLFLTVDQSFEISSYNVNYDRDIPSSSSCLFSSSYAFFNGNTSSSEPMSWAQKLELPSTQMGSCNAPSNSSSQSQNLQQHDNPEAYGDPMSPLGHSDASVFSEYTPHRSGSSLDEHQSIETISGKQEAEESGVKESDREDQKQNHVEYLPDFLLGSNWFGSTSDADRNKDHCEVSSPIRALLGNDFCSDSKHNSGSPFSWTMRV